ncbi:MAG: ATP-binding protein [Candidatus Hydrothermarchaeota archaeon]
MKEIGTVISEPSPSPSEFAFVLNVDGLAVRKGNFVQLETEEGTMIANVKDLYKSNRYFEKAETVREYERSGRPLSSIFPAPRWEITVGIARPLGVFSSETLNRATYPPSTGTKVYLADEGLLSKFLGSEENGINVGTLRFHDLPIKLNMTRLFQKHLAILAMSGAGKSYLVSVLLEELLSRKEGGRLGVIIFDVHGEYTGFSTIPPQGYVDYSGSVNVFSGEDISIGVPNLSAGDFSKLLPNITPVQKRELSRILNNLKMTFDSYSLEDIVEFIQKDPDMNKKTKEAMISWLIGLDDLGLFGKYDYPSLKKIVEPRRATIFDLSDIIDMQRKQIIVAHIARRLFNLRRSGEICPFLIVLEEAHQFIPEGERVARITREIFETIAREGRKFYASLCLVSQRPIKLSTTVLSQCNTHIILRVTNPYDLDHIGRSSEGITRDVLDQISTLRVGEALIVGEAINQPIFVKVRERTSQPPLHSLSLEEACILYENKEKEELEDSDIY